MKSVVLLLTYNAIKKLFSLRVEYPDFNLFIGVSSGGCRDFYYDIQFIKKEEMVDVVCVSILNQDSVVQKIEDIKIYTNLQSEDFIHHSVLDYCQDLMQESFEIISNLNTRSLCGCGISFKKND